MVYNLYKILDKVQIIHNNSKHPFKLREVVTIFRVFADNTFDVCNANGDCWRVNVTEIFKLEDPMKQMTEAVINTAKALCKAQNQVTTLEIKTEVMSKFKHFHWTQNYVSAVMDDAYKAGMFTFVESDGISAPRHRIYSETGVVIKNVKVKKPMKKALTVAKKTKTATKAVTKPKVSVTPTVRTVPASKTISKTKALELMKNNKGHFFTATFIKKEGDVRTMNCQYLKDQSTSELGYVKVKEAIKAKVAKNAAKKAVASKKRMPKEDAIRQINIQTLKELKIAGNSYKVK